jgi:hypothetical protein
VGGGVPQLLLGACFDQESWHCAESGDCAPCCLWLPHRPEAVHCFRAEVHGKDGCSNGDKDSLRASGVAVCGHRFTGHPTHAHNNAEGKCDLRTSCSPHHAQCSVARDKDQSLRPVANISHSPPAHSPSTAGLTAGFGCRFRRRRRQNVASLSFFFAF